MKSILLLIVLTSSICFAIEKEELRGILLEAQKIQKLKEPFKQQSALVVIKKSFKIVRSNKSNIPGNQAPGIENRLRGIYKDVKKKNYQSFNEAVSEGENTFKLYDSAGSLLDLLN